MKKILSGFAAAMLLVTAVGCGSSGGGKKQSRFVRTRRLENPVSLP